VANNHNLAVGMQKYSFLFFVFTEGKVILQNI